MPFGDDFDSPIGHFDGGLIVDRVCRRRSSRGPYFRVGQGVLRGSLVIQVREHREIDQSQCSVVAGGQIACRRLATEPVVGQGSPKLGVSTMLPELTPT